MITITIERSQYKPGETLSGRVSGDALASGIPGEVRLFYHTQGKGDRDIVIQHSVPIQAGASAQPFSFSLPKQPWSFSGELITLVWAVEAVVGKQNALAEFTLSPTGSEIKIGPPDRPSLKGMVTTPSGFNAGR